MGQEAVERPRTPVSICDLILQFIFGPWPEWGVNASPIRQRTKRGSFIGPEIAEQMAEMRLVEAWDLYVQNATKVSKLLFTLSFHARQF